MPTEHLEILKKLEKRRRRKVEINKSRVSAIQYHADLRKNIEREQNRAERDRIKGHLSKVGTWQPQIMRDRYNELQRVLAENRRAP